jgi:hypothetical protein
MKITIEFDTTDAAFHRMAIDYFNREEEPVRSATDEEVQRFAQAAFDEWLACAEEQYLNSDAGIKE